MHLTYADVFRPAARNSALAYDATLVLAGSLLLAAGAQVAFYLPGTPVPITGQTLAVLLAGVLLGPVRGPAAGVTYLLQGAAGLPVFAAGNAGGAYILGPTGGYLLAFVPAAWVVGLLSRRGWDRHAWSLATAMLLGSLVIYAGGMLWLVCCFGAANALAMGVGPFIIGDLVKIAASAMLLPGGWKILRQIEQGGR